MNKAELLIKKEIIKLAMEWNADIHMPDDCDLICFYDENKYEFDELQDVTEEVRCGGVSTGLDGGSSRHYESDRVAMKIDGEWVSWIYWHGGGKHGEPSAIEWIESAIILKCKEIEVTSIERTFTI